jgi:hypothetical protein
MATARGSRIRVLFLQLCARPLLLNPGLDGFVEAGAVSGNKSDGGRKQ